MSFDSERTYELLPAIYRIRDADRGEPLKALLSVVADQVGVLEEDLAQLYDDQFIETCAPWWCRTSAISLVIARCTTLCQRSAVNVRKSRTRLVSAAAKERRPCSNNLPEMSPAGMHERWSFFNCSGGRNGRQITFAPKTFTRLTCVSGKRSKKLMARSIRWHIPWTCGMSLRHKANTIFRISASSFGGSAHI